MKTSIKNQLKNTAVALVIGSLLAAAAPTQSRADSDPFTTFTILAFTITVVSMAKENSRDVAPYALAVLQGEVPSDFFSDLRNQIEERAGKSFNSDQDAAMYILAVLDLQDQK